MSMRISEIDREKLFNKHGEGITQGLLKEVFVNIDDVLYREHKAGTLKPSGTLTEGYIKIKLFGRQYAAHRLIWCWHTGAMPPDDMEIDHENHIKSDNTFTNLKLVDRKGQMKNKGLGKNSTTGVIGVATYRPTGKFRAYIRDAQGKIEHLGYRDTLEEAVALRKSAEIRLGYHPNHGKLLTSTNHQGNLL
mgnify:CR=1 FL=1